MTLTNEQVAVLAAAVFLQDTTVEAVHVTRYAQYFLDWMHTARPTPQAAGTPDRVGVPPCADLGCPSRVEGQRHWHETEVQDS